MVWFLLLSQKVPEQNHINPTSGFGDQNLTSNYGWSMIDCSEVSLVILIILIENCWHLILFHSVFRPSLLFHGLDPLVLEKFQVHLCAPFFSAALTKLFTYQRPLLVIHPKWKPRVWGWLWSKAHDVMKSLESYECNTEAYYDYSLSRKTGLALLFTSLSR